MPRGMLEVSKSKAAPQALEASESLKDVIGDLGILY